MNFKLSHDLCWETDENFHFLLKCVKFHWSAMIITFDWSVMSRNKFWDWNSLWKKIKFFMWNISAWKLKVEVKKLIAEALGLIA